VCITVIKNFERGWTITIRRKGDGYLPKVKSDVLLKGALPNIGGGKKIIGVTQSARKTVIKNLGPGGRR